jgi:hypothetical protein
MKVIVFGSRTWHYHGEIWRRFRQLPPDTIIVHGASKGGGADQHADEIARAQGLTVIPVPVNAEDRRRAVAKGRPRMAPILRNIRIYDEHPDAEIAIGFWDGKSPGSKHMRDEGERRGIPVEMHTVRPEQLVLRKLAVRKPGREQTG